MSINTTPNLHLPQWTADEQPSFLAEINGAWSSIDTGYGQNKTDAATAITTSNNAVSIAEGAKQQSQANAGIITQLQQQFAALQTAFNDAGKIVVDTPVITSNIDGIEIRQYYANHNRFIAQIGFYINFGKAKTYSSFQNIPICTISGLPYTWSTINATIGETIGPVPNITTGSLQFYNAPACTIKSDGGVYVNLGEVVTTSNTTIALDVTFAIPIYQATGSREAIPENCAVLL